MAKKIRHQSDGATLEHRSLAEEDQRRVAEALAHQDPDVLEVTLRQAALEWAGKERKSLSWQTLHEVAAAKDREMKERRGAQTTQKNRALERKAARVQIFREKVWPTLAPRHGKPGWRDEARRLCREAGIPVGNEERTLDRLLKHARDAGVVPRLRVRVSDKT